jgi:hypothetical protein
VAIEDFLTPVAVILMGFLGVEYASWRLKRSLSGFLMNPETQQSVLETFAKPTIDYGFRKLTGSIGGEIGGLTHAIQGAAVEGNPIIGAAKGYVPKGLQKWLPLLAMFLNQGQGQSAQPSNGGSSNNPWEK